MNLNHKIKYYLTVLFTILSFSLFGQFIISESFSNSNIGANVIIGDDAYLTANRNIDTNGNGWLRLTEALNNQKGYAYIDQTFLSEQGVKVEFDYKTWKNSSGADGFTVFLFNGEYGNVSGTYAFKTGAYGGSLGYANNLTTPGMTGGYIGIGFDEFGNYAPANEGKIGGTTASSGKNHISIRGKAPDYRYIFGKVYNSGIAYNRNINSRPTDSQFYRRVRVEIIPEAGKYRVKVAVKRSTTGNFEEQLSTLITDEPYPRLKIGFAASTGGSTNFHEIRNVSVTVPGGISVKKTADKTHLSTSTNNLSNYITYTIKVSNFQNVDVHDISFTDIIQDINGRQLNENQFVVESIQLSDFINNSSNVLTNNQNKITGTLGLQQYSIGTIIVKGKLLGDIDGSKIINAVNVMSNSFTDDNLENNTSLVQTDVIQAFNDVFRWGQSNFLVGTNDKLDGANTIPIFNGSSKNASISTVGNWPSGITLNTNTGEIIIANGINMPTSPLQYSICNLQGVCSVAEIIFYNQANDLSITGTVNNQCNYNGNTNRYTLTINNNSPFPIRASNNDKISINFSINNGGFGYSEIEQFTSSIWTISNPIAGCVTCNYTLTLNQGQEIPAYGSINLDIVKNWNIIGDIDGSVENNIKSIEFKLNYVNASNENVDGNTKNNSVFISVFRTSNVNATNVSAQVGHGDVITVGEVANLGIHTKGFKFYLNDGTEIPSDYLIPTTVNNVPFTFKYSSACNTAQATVTVSVGIPDPGSIGPLQNIVCYDGSVTINNNQLGLGTFLTSAEQGRYLLKYTWEISYDDGETWMAAADTAGADTEGATSITINNVTSNLKIRRKAHERPTTDRVVNYAYTDPVDVIVQKNKIIFPDNVNSFAVAEGDDFILPNISSTLISDITIYNSAGDEVSGTVSNLSKGVHRFTVRAITTGDTNQVSGCETLDYITVTVYDLADCNIYKNKVYATHQLAWTSGLSGVNNPEKSVNGNRADHATLTGGVVILGLGTVGIDLYFTKQDPNDSTKRIMVTAEDMKGKRVTVKLGEQYSGLKVAGGLSVRALNTSRAIDNLSAAPNQVGATFGVKGGVLDALKGDNVFNFSFIPTDSNGNTVAYNGIRIQLGSLLGVADLATVFHAYIEEELTLANGESIPVEIIKVTPPSTLLYPENQRDIDGSTLNNIKNSDIVLNDFVDDVTWGNYSEVLNVASSLSSVVYPYYAVDDNYDSYALFNATAGVLNKQFLHTHLRQTARPGDQIQITLAYPNINVLNLSLLQLGNFKIVYYLNGAEVGQELLEEFRILDIGLFNFRDKRRAVISKPISIPFDSFKIEQFNTVSVNLGDGLHIHDVRVAPMMLFAGQSDPKEITTICASEFLAIKSLDVCTEYEISLAKVVTFGNPYQNEDGSELVDAEGTPVKSILEVEDIPNSNLEFSHFDANNRYYKIERLFTEYENEGIILIKIQTKRQGANYGAPQYLKVKLKNCLDAIINPVIKSGI